MNVTRDIDLAALRLMSENGAETQDYWIDEQNAMLDKADSLLVVSIVLFLLTVGIIYFSLHVQRTLIDSREHHEEKARKAAAAERRRLEEERAKFALKDKEVVKIAFKRNTMGEQWHVNNINN